jgi:hypothetical protein
MMDLNELERTTTSLPIVGYTVWWSLSGIRVRHPELATALQGAGFGDYLPSPPTYRVALRRALEAWGKAQRAEMFAGSEAQAMPSEEEETDGDTAQHRGQRTLIRTINAYRSSHMVFALVSEGIDFAALGLAHATSLRILLEKQTGVLVITTQARGTILTAQEAEEAIQTGMIAAEQEAQLFARSLQPFWDQYRELHLSGDLSRMMREIVCGQIVERTARRKADRERTRSRSGLGAISLRPGGGLYFVPADQGQALMQLRHMLEALPTDGVSEPFMVVQGVPDEKQTKRQLAKATHAGFLDEIAALAADLDRVLASRKAETTTLAARLAAYKQVAAKVQTYADLLGMQHDSIQQSLGTLRDKAMEVLMASEDGEAGESGEEEVPLQEAFINSD